MRFAEIASYRDRLTRGVAGLVRHDWRSLVLYLTALILILVGHGQRLWLLKVRAFDQDEFEHLHTAWSISKGMLPYRDFFEHHTPWFDFFLAVFYPLFRVDTDVGSAFSFIFFARYLMWIFTGGIIALTFLLGHLWGGARVAWVGAVLLIDTVIFQEKTLEIRPDVFGVICWLACLALLVQGVRSERPADRRTTRSFAWSGALLGVSVMSSQKILVGMPAFALALLWYLIDPEGHGDFNRRIRNILLHIAGFCVPILLTVGYFALRGGLREFIHFCLLLNLRWRLHFAPYKYLRQLVHQNPAFVALAAVGILKTASRVFSHVARRRGDFLVVLPTIGLIVGLFLIPVPHRQYYLTFLPLLAVLAGNLLIYLLDAYATLTPQRRHRSLLTEAVFLAVLTAGALWYTFSVAISQTPSSEVYSAVWPLALVAAAMFLLRGFRDLALALVLIAASLYPLQQTRHAFTRHNTATLHQLRYVLEHTTRTDTIMDGWSGLGVFRPHAYFYWFLHGDILALLSDEDLARLLADLQSARIAPKLIVLDRDLRRLPEETTMFFLQHYEPVGVGSIWRRKDAHREGPGHQTNGAGIVSLRAASLEGRYPLPLHRRAGCSRGMVVARSSSWQPSS